MKKLILFPTLFFFSSSAFAISEFGYGKCEKYSINPYRFTQHSEVNNVEILPVGHEARRCSKLVRPFFSHHG